MDYDDYINIYIDCRLFFTTVFGVSRRLRHGEWWQTIATLPGSVSTTLPGDRSRVERIPSSSSDRQRTVVILQSLLVEVASP